MIRSLRDRLIRLVLLGGLVWVATSPWLGLVSVAAAQPPANATQPAAPTQAPTDSAEPASTAQPPGPTGAGSDDAWGFEDEEDEQKA